jgi:hypothetical protein
MPKNCLFIRQLVSGKKVRQQRLSGRREKYFTTQNRRNSRLCFVSSGLFRDMT